MFELLVMASRLLPDDLRDRGSRHSLYTAFMFWKESNIWCFNVFCSNREHAVGHNKPVPGCFLSVFYHYTKLSPISTRQFYRAF